MHAADVAKIEAVLAIIALVVATVIAVVRVAPGDAAHRWHRRVEPMLLPFAALVAVVATAGSLWFSEGAHFPPCKLCWFQRIAMYPLAVVLTIAAARRDRLIRPYALVLSCAGLAVNLYHLYVETFPARSHGGCDPINPCTIRWVEAYGFWTIPRLAFAAFVAITACLACLGPRKEAHA